MKRKFQRKVRLVTKTQLNQVLKKAKQRISREEFNIYYCNSGLIYPRLGIIIPKKSINQASRRNYFKRIIREHFRLSQDKIKPVDMLFFVKKNIERITKRELTQVLAEQLNRINL
jgi:ribonuclease P protein component